MAESAWVEVVTRYGGHKHFAHRGGLTRDDDRYFTLCMGTSSWTVPSWVRKPDHPLLSTEEILALPRCPRCLEMAGPVAPKPTVTRAEAQAAIDHVLETTEWYCDDDHEWDGRANLTARLRAALQKDAS